MPRLLVALSLTLTLAAGEAAGNAAAGDDLAKQVKESFRIQPQHVNLEYSLSFEDGELEQERSELNLGVVMTFAEGLPIVGIKDFTITGATTDTGADLDAGDQNRYRGGYYHRAGRGRNVPRFDQRVEFEAPPAGTMAIAEITGKVTVQLVTGKRKKVTLSPIAQWTADTARIEGIEGGTVRLRLRDRDGDQKHVEVVFGTAMQGLVDEVRFYGKDGAQLEANRWGGGSGGATFSQSYGVEGLGDEGKAVVYFYEKLTEVEVGFTLKDIPCRPTPKAAGANKVLKPEDADVPGKPKDDGVEEAKIRGKNDLEF